MSRMQNITLVWADGTEEEVLCDNWVWRNEVITICLNSVTRSYRYIEAQKIREVRQTG